MNSMTTTDVDSQNQNSYDIVKINYLLIPYYTFI